MLFLSAPLHCLRKTKAFRALINSRINNPDFYHIGFNHKVALRPFTHASILWKKSKLEPEIRNLMIFICKEVVRKNSGHFFLDVGANVGLYTWEMAKIAPELKIMSFEPDPNNFKLLCMTHEKSGFKNIELCPFALSNQNKITDFVVDTLTSATGSLSNDNKPWVEKFLNASCRKIKVQTKTLDEMMGGNKIPSLVKIDVEGHENEVLEGGMATIKKFKPLMIVESFPPKQQKVIKSLSEVGYRLYDADRLSPLQKGTNNLFCFHDDGPLDEGTIEKIISK